MKANIVDVYAERHFTSLIAENAQMRELAKKVITELCGMDITVNTVKFFFRECADCFDYCRASSSVEMQIPRA